MLELNAEENVISLIKRCHVGLNGMRGVVLSLASFNFRDALMTWIGVGNVQGTLLRHDPGVSEGDRALLHRPADGGNHLPPLQPEALTVFSVYFLIHGP